VKLVIQDSETLRSLSPTKVALYLRSKDWKRHRHEADRFSTWVKAFPGEAVTELLLPELDSFSDYPLRIAELLDDLTRLSEQSQYSLFMEIVEVDLDVHRFRSDALERLPGSVALDEGVALVNTARDAIIAAACTVEGPRARIPGRRPRKVEDALRGASLGQTEIGSYVVKAQLPVAPKIQDDLFESQPAEAEPFERLIGQRLIEAMGALRQAAMEGVETGSIGSLQSLLERGVSAELCAAFIDLQEKTRSPFVEVTSTWAAARPLAFRSEVRPSTVRIESNLIAPIRRVAASMRARSPVEEITIFGYPLALEQPRQVEIFGVATLLALVPELGDAVHQILVQLPRHLYDQCWEAQQNKRFVRVSGALEKRGTRWHLIGPHDFSQQQSEEETSQQ
jgi:hypothetical protein